MRPLRPAALLPALLPVTVPVDLGRDAAQAAARAELAGAEYQHDRPSWWERVTGWLLDRLQDLLSRLGDAAPGGWLGLTVVAMLVVLLLVALRRGLGPLGRGRDREHALFAGGPRSSAEHRAAADEAAAAGRWAEAVRERMRAVVRDLEERGLLEPRPGRTADEAAGEAGSALPDHAADLRAAARTFDDIWYGGRPATADADARLRAVDERVRRARPVGGSAGGPAGGSGSGPAADPAGRSPARTGSHE